MFRYLTAGESHGPQLTAIIDGFPSGFTVDARQLQVHMQRRQGGYGRGGRMKIERDTVQVTSGLRYGKTLGSPITLVVPNLDWENWERLMNPWEGPPEKLTPREDQRSRETTRPRPGHADLAGGIKYDHHDMRNVLERASARETAARTAVGALCRQFLSHFGISIGSHVVQIGAVRVGDDFLSGLSPAHINERADTSEARCLDPEAEAQMIAAIREAKSARDTLGGVAQLIVSGLPVGLGDFSQAAQRLDARLASALMSIPSAKGVEFGLGFESAARRGSEVHDEIFYDASRGGPGKGFYRNTNAAGGIEGGMSNGEDIIARIACKPISTLNKPLRTVDLTDKQATEAMVERSDNCIVPAFAVICEAVAAIELTTAFLTKFGGDSMRELDTRYQAYLDDPY